LCWGEAIEVDAARMALLGGKAIVPHRAWHDRGQHNTQT